MSAIRVPSVVLCSILVGGCGSREAAPPTPAAAEWTDPAPHQVGFVTVPGGRLQYLDWGGTGPALILIHGYGDNPHAFDDLAPALAGQYRVVAYARRGHGRSSKEPPFDGETLTEDLRALLDSLGIAKAHLAGWSMGGNEVTAFAGKYPDRTGRIVYLDAAFDWADPAVQAAFAEAPLSLTATGEALASLDAFRTWYRDTFFSGVSDPSRIEGYLRDLVDVAPDGSVRLVMSDSVAAALWGTLASHRRDYRNVAAPALAIYATTFFDPTRGDSALRAKVGAWESDKFEPFRKVSIDRVRRELRGVEILTVPGTHGDFLFVARDQVVEAIRRFLAAAG